MVTCCCSMYSESINTAKTEFSSWWKRRGEAASRRSNICKYRTRSGLRKNRRSSTTYSLQSHESTNALEWEGEHQQKIGKFRSGRKPQQKIMAGGNGIPLPLLTLRITYINVNIAMAVSLRQTVFIREDSRTWCEEYAEFEYGGTIFTSNLECKINVSNWKVRNLYTFRYD